jgi:cobalt-zinc-cadmium resistance protein CzcA
MVNQSEAELRLIERKVELETSLAYFALVWRQHRFKLIERNYMQYAEATKIADLKYQSGESNLLSKVMMESEYEELRLLMQQADADHVAAKEALRKSIQSDISYDAELDSLEKIDIDFNPDSLFAYYERSAFINLLSKGLQVSEQNIRLQKASISPRIGLGYFNQQLDHVRGFEGWEISLKMPLWFRPNSGQIQSAKIQYEIFDNAFRQQRFNRLSDLKVLTTQRSTLLDKLNSYERVSLRNAGLISQNANLLFQNGEIEYLEYIRSIGQAISIRLGYLDTLHEYNRVTLQLNHLIK